MKLNVVVALFVLWCPSVSAQELTLNASPGTATTRVLGYSVGYFGSIFIHETGHLVTALALFSPIKHYKPYPHMLKGQFVMGSVAHGNKSRFAQTTIAFMGVGANMLWAYFGASLIPKTTGTFARATLLSSLYTSAFTFPFYVAFDLFASFGDIHIIEKASGIPKWIWIVPSLVSSYFLYRHITKQHLGEAHGFTVNGRGLGSSADSFMRFSLHGHKHQAEGHGGDTTNPAPAPEILFDPISKAWGLGAQIRI